MAYLTPAEFARKAGMSTRLVNDLIDQELLPHEFTSTGEPIVDADAGLDWLREQAEDADEADEDEQPEDADEADEDEQAEDADEADEDEQAEDADEADEDACA